MSLLRILLSLSACAGLAGPLLATDSVSELRRSGTHVIKVDELERSFLIDVPEHLKPGAPLVMVFHGYGSSAEAIRKSSRFTPLVEDYGFVAVYPMGTKDNKGNRFFNVGYEFHKSMKADDVKFAEGLVAKLVDELELDPLSIFSTGMSNGADMSYLLACQTDPFVRAIAPVAGCMMAAWTEDFTVDGRTPVMEVHGTNDKVTLWAGDPNNRYGWGAYLGTDAVMDFWVKTLALEKSDVTELPGIQSRKELQGLSLHRWWTAADKMEVRLYKIQGGGHRWPDNLGIKEVSTANEIWNFFQRHRPR